MLASRAQIGGRRLPASAALAAISTFAVGGALALLAALAVGIAFAVLAALAVIATLAVLAAGAARLSAPTVRPAFAVGA